jgi:threonine dehydrogenase-like Zn-dependent dehydrogenase
MRREISAVIDLIRRGDLDVRPLITHILPYTGAPAMYDLLAAGGEGRLSVAFSWHD